MSTAFHHVPVEISRWNFYSICVLVISCHSPKVEVIGQKVKGHGSEMRSIFSESVSLSTAFHRVTIGGSWWNFNITCVLVISCHTQTVEVIGQKVKGHGSKMRSFSGLFGLKKKLGPYRMEFGSEILDLGPLNKYKKTQEIKFWIFWLFLEKMSKNSQK
jgi:hypothetical protein